MLAASYQPCAWVCFSSCSEVRPVQEMVSLHLPHTGSAQAACRWMSFARWSSTIHGQVAPGRSRSRRALPAPPPLTYFMPAQARALDLNGV